MVANATGCSSIYGGNLPTTPWTVNGEGRGPAWSNSLFEDNAEFGLGLRLAVDQHMALARKLLLRDGGGHRRGTRGGDPERLAADRIGNPPAAGARRRAQGPARLERNGRRQAACCRWPTTWSGARCGCIGGDGWAYDIGSSGLDHVLASGRNVNILVLDTEVYSNTGGQASKSTPIGAVAKFATAARASARRTSRCRRSPTATSTSRASRWAPTRSRRCAPSARPRPTTVRR